MENQLFGDGSDSAQDIVQVELYDLIQELLCLNNLFDSFLCLE